MRSKRQGIGNTERARKIAQFDGRDHGRQTSHLSKISGYASPSNIADDDGRIVKIWADLQQLVELHQEVELCARESGTELATFLDANGFWETPLRASCIPDVLRRVAENMRDRIQVLLGPQVRMASDAELRSGGATSARYLKQLRQSVRKVPRTESGWAWLDRDKTTLVTPFTEDAARRVVGAVLEAVRWVMLSAPSAPCRRACVVARPPGHHNGCNERLESMERQAWRFAAHGGCVFNETAVAIHSLRSRRPCVRVAVLDVDAHFGDGTAWHFYDTSEVFCVSLHVDQSDLNVYPYLKGKAQERGEGAGAGFNLNLPLREGMGDAEAIYLLKDLAVPALEKYRPELLFVGLGFDGLAGDPSSSGLRYSTAFFEHLAAMASKLCPRVVCTLQGGYLPNVMGSALEDFLQVMSGGTPRGPLPTDVGVGWPDYVANLRDDLRDSSKWWPLARSFDYVPPGFELDERCEADEESLSQENEIVRSL